MGSVSSWCPQVPAHTVHTSTMPSRRVTLPELFQGTPFASAALWRCCSPSLSLQGWAAGQSKAAAHGGATCADPLRHLPPLPFHNIQFLQPKITQQLDSPATAASLKPRASTVPAASAVPTATSPASHPGRGDAWHPKAPHVPAGAHRDEEEDHTAEGEAAGVAKVAWGGRRVASGCGRDPCTGSVSPPCPAHPGWHHHPVGDPGCQTPVPWVASP